MAIVIFKNLFFSLGEYDRLNPSLILGIGVVKGRSDAKPADLGDGQRSVATSG
jgi:hypothetical protein